MTKAARIFKDIYAECRLHIMKWGYEENAGFNRISDELVYTRTKNEIAKLINSEKRHIEFSFEHNMMTVERAVLLSQAIKMVEKTLENTYIS